MKRIAIPSLLLAVVLTSACNSFLDKEPLDMFTDENFWESENTVASYANSFYEQFAGYGNGNSYGDFYFKTLSDDQAGGYSFADWTFTNVPANSAEWKDGWVEIRRANILVDRVDRVNMSDAAKAHWRGVGRLMRAWQYYKLVRNYGDLPWVDKPIDFHDEAKLYGPRESRDVVMDKVLEDLNYACENMYDNTSRTTLNRNVAYAMKAEICLFEGTFRKYRKAEDGQTAPDAAGATRYLTAARDAAAHLMSKSFKLNPSYQENYNAVDLSSNPEMIFYKAYKKDVMQHSLVAYVSSSTQLNGMSKDAFEAYLFTDGKPLALTSLDKGDAARAIPVTRTVAGKTVHDTVMSISHLLALRDKRLSATIDTALCYVGRGFTRYGVGMAMTSSTGYGVCKYDNPALPERDRNQTTRNYTHAPLFWLSVVYLEYAEACAELGSITQADLDRSVNLLRDRAGLPHLNVNPGFDDPANKMGVSSLIWEIRRERRCELMFDNDFRYWDLIRWHQLDRLDSSTHPDILNGANISADVTDKLVTRSGNYVNGSKGKTRTYDKKHYWYPIPTDQMDLNKQLKQNPGW